MKKVIAAALTLFAFLPSFAQLTNVNEKTIGVVKRMSSVFIWLNERQRETDTTYILRYENEDPRPITQFQTIEFKGLRAVIDLYSSLKECFRKNKGQETSFILGSTPIRVKTERYTGTKYIQIFEDKGNTVVFTEKDLNRLSGNRLL